MSTIPKKNVLILCKGVSLECTVRHFWFLKVCYTCLSMGSYYSVDWTAILTYFQSLHTSWLVK